MTTVRKVPYENAFKRADLFTTIANWGLYISSSTTIIYMVGDHKEWNETLLTFINAMSCLFIAVVFIFQFLFSYFFFEASRSKRLDFIDNSFGSSFSTENSQGYFSNDNLNVGLLKMAVNTFENVLFTHRVSGKMVPRSWLKSALISFIFIFSAAMGQKDVVVAIFQIALPLLFIQESILITQLSLRTKRLFHDFASLFSTLKSNPTLNDKDAAILKFVFDYETVKSSSGIKTSSRIFKKINPEVSVEWNNIKTQYNITN